MRGRDLGAGGAAGLEHEGGGRGLGREDDPLVEDHEAAIEEFAELDAAAGVGAMMGAGGELNPAGPEADGVVAGDLAGVAAAEHEGEIPGGGPPSGRGGGRIPREARVQVGEELGEKGVGARGGREVAQAQLGRAARTEDQRGWRAAAPVGPLLPVFPGVHE